MGKRNIEDRNNHPRSLKICNHTLLNYYRIMLGTQSGAVSTADGIARYVSLRATRHPPSHPLACEIMKF